MVEKNWQRVYFICSKCGVKTWTEFDLNKYALKVEDLLCDDCNPVEEGE